MSDDKSTTEKKYLTLDDVAAIDDVRYVEVEAWGGVLRFASLPAEEMIAFLEANESAAGKKTAAARLIAMSVVDGDGKRIGSPKYLEMLRKRDSATIAMIVGKLLDLNNADKLEAQLTEAKKSSGEATFVSSPSVLH